MTTLTVDSRNLLQANVGSHSWRFFFLIWWTAGFMHSSVWCWDDWCTFGIANCLCKLTRYNSRSLVKGQMLYREKSGLFPLYYGFKRSCNRYNISLDILWFACSIGANLWCLLYNVKVALHCTLSPWIIHSNAITCTTRVVCCSWVNNVIKKKLEEIWPLWDYCTFNLYVLQKLAM